MAASAVAPVNAAAGNSQSHAASGAHSVDNANNMFTNQAIWGQLQALEDQVKQLTDKMTGMEQAHQLQVNMLTAEVASLKKQLDAKESAAGQTV